MRNNDDEDEAPSPVEDGPSYARDLRVVGQAIEALQMRDFEVEVDGRDYIVRGRAAAKKNQGGAKSRLLTWSTERKPSPPEPEPQMVEVRYSPEVLERLEATNKAKRQYPKGMPEPLSPPELLRAVGNYLDAQRAQPKRILRQGEVLTVELETSYGGELEEERHISSFHGRSIHMYLRRADRSA